MDSIQTFKSLLADYGSVAVARAVSRCEAFKAQATIRANEIADEAVKSEKKDKP